MLARDGSTGPSSFGLTSSLVSSLWPYSYHRGWAVGHDVAIACTNSLQGYSRNDIETGYLISYSLA